MLQRYTLTTRPFPNGMPGQFVVFNCDTQEVVATCPTQIEIDAWKYVRKYNKDHSHY